MITLLNKMRYTSVVRVPAEDYWVRLRLAYPVMYINSLREV